MNKHTKNTESTHFSNSTENEKSRRNEFTNSLFNAPIPKDAILNQIGLFSRRQILSRILFMNNIYQRILDVPGVVIEFGVRWGQNLALFSNYRGMYEPYNYSRKIIGFDTFEGFPSVDKDKDNKLLNKSDFTVENNYEDFLRMVLDFHESESPLSHIKKYELVKGDATKTFPTYLEEHPETIVALAYFDFDIYQPTKICLEHLKSRLIKGSVVAFDELNFENFPGETRAVMEVLGLNNLRLKRDVNNTWPSYFIVE